MVSNLQEHLWPGRCKVSAWKKKVHMCVKAKLVSKLSLLSIYGLVTDLTPLLFLAKLDLA